MLSYHSHEPIEVVQLPTLPRAQNDKEDSRFSIHSCNDYGNRVLVYCKVSIKSFSVAHFQQSHTWVFMSV